MPSNQGDGTGADGANSDNMTDEQQEQSQPDAIVDTVVVEDNNSTEDSGEEQEGDGMMMPSEDSPAPANQGADDNLPVPVVTDETPSDPSPMPS